MLMLLPPLALFALAACDGESLTGIASTTTPEAAVAGAAGGTTVTDLTVVGVSDSTVRLEWTQVSDGTGAPAYYRVKYAVSPMDWRSAEVGCNPTLRGDAVGSVMSCTVQGLTRGKRYDFQLMSYRLENDRWRDATYSNLVYVRTGTGTTPVAESVDDLEISDRSPSSLTLRWTEVDDGVGEPALYRVKYARPNLEWGSATVGCDSTVEGDGIGTDLSCTIEGLRAGTTYDVQLMSYRVVDGAWQGAAYSNVTRGTTYTAWGDEGIWIARGALGVLPTWGPAWDNVISEAGRWCGSVILNNQYQSTNVCIMAKALVAVRTGDTSVRAEVVKALEDLADSSTYWGSALSLGRGLAAYVIAADVIDLRRLDPGLDAEFRTKIRELLTTWTNSGPTSLVDCHERRPNNWGTHCGASRAAVAAYLGDEEELARAAQVFKGWLGDRSSYAGFVYGDLSWQCDPARPVGINPEGCSRNGRTIDGVVPDDQRRSGAFTWPPPQENYVWEALQGALVQAVILERAGYPAFEWEDRALLRAVEWLYQDADYRVEGDDAWEVHVINKAYGRNFAAPLPARPGKNVGWTDWTHRR